MRVVAALTTMPRPRAWAACALAYVVFLACALPLGLATGLVRPGAPSMTPYGIVVTAAVVLVHPAFVEELIFRVLLLPRPGSSTSRGRRLLIAGASLALYVASHPLNAILFRPQARGVFDRPAYLALAAMLGATCTAAYWISRSIWPAVAIHWLTVVAWLSVLGGQALLC